MGGSSSSHPAEGYVSRYISSLHLEYPYSTRMMDSGNEYLDGREGRDARRLRELDASYKRMFHLFAD